jgi:hypothetical protein
MTYSHTMVCIWNTVTEVELVTIMIHDLPSTIRRRNISFILYCIFEGRSVNGNGKGNSLVHCGSIISMK